MISAWHLLWIVPLSLSATLYAGCSQPTVKINTEESNEDY